MTNLWHIRIFCFQMNAPPPPPEVMHKRQIKAIQSRRRKNLLRHVWRHSLGSAGSVKGYHVAGHFHFGKEWNRDDARDRFHVDSERFGSAQEVCSASLTHKWNIESPRKKAQNFFLLFLSLFVLHPIFSRRMLYCTHCFRDVGTLTIRCMYFFIKWYPLYSFSFATNNTFFVPVEGS